MLLDLVAEVLGRECPVEPFLMGFGGEEQELLLQEGLSRWEDSAQIPPPHKPLLPPGRSASPEVCPQPHTGTIPWQLRPKSQVTHISDCPQEDFQMFSEDPRVFVVSSLRQMFNPRQPQSRGHQPGTETSSLFG